MKKENQSKKIKNMSTKKISKNIKSNLLDLTNFVVSICSEVTHQDSYEDNIRQAMLDHQDKLVKILQTNFSVKKESTLKKVKDPVAPKRGKSSYIYFCVEKREEIKSSNPDMSAKDIIKELARIWREDTSEKEKARYNKMSAEDKSRYEEEMKDYTPPENSYDIEKNKSKGPKRGLSAYIFFCKEHRENLKKEKSELSTKDLTAELGKLWNNLSDKDREPYNKLADKDKTRYENEKKIWLEDKSDSHVSKKNKSKKDSNTESLTKKTNRKSGYVLYCQEKRNAIKDVNNDMTNQQITKELARTWKELSEKERDEYNNR